MQYNFICIEGNIGAGKTSLAKKISEDCNARLILEEFANNPFLPNFYKEPEKYAFPLELFFMAERYKQLKEVMVQEIFSSFTVSDYFFIKSRLFAQNNLSKDELTLFYRLFDIMLASLPKPDLLVYLHADIQCLQKNIKKRDRTYEQDITDGYLLKIQKKYLDFFKTQNDFPVLIIDVTDTDFVQNDVVYQKIVSAIKKPYSLGVHQLRLK
jgi:deoxyguanosine kinase|tara:strand:+ start:1396 stop:2028 length:633 start_codon:yes stop_codon:yes gene_type:complete